MEFRRQLVLGHSALLLVTLITAAVAAIALRISSARLESVSRGPARGRWGNTMTSPEGKRYVSSGEIRELVPSERLVVFDEGKGEPMLGHATTITVTFGASGSGTTMKLVHGVFKSVEMRDECVRGWASTFNRLERLMRGEVE